jgi:amino-acid N-acetyltransferase
MHDRMSVATEQALEIRRAVPADWEHVAALLSTSSLLLDGAREHLGDFFIATRDDHVVGCAGVERYDDTGLLRSVAVAASERGRGTGARLIERCIADASAAGLTRLVLLTTTAERYFPRFGFETVARDAVPQVVRESVEFRSICCASATVMQLALTPERR